MEKWETSMWDEFDDNLSPKRARRAARISGSLLALAVVAIVIGLAFAEYIGTFTTWFVVLLMMAAIPLTGITIWLFFRAERIQSQYPEDV